jgi:hypothetical protein
MPMRYTKPYPALVPSRGGPPGPRAGVSHEALSQPASVGRPAVLDSIACTRRDATPWYLPTTVHQSPTSPIKRMWWVGRGEFVEIGARTAQGPPAACIPISLDRSVSGPREV